MRSRVLAIVAATALSTIPMVLAVAQPAAALTGTITAPQLIAACQAGPVVLTGSLKVEGGNATSAGGCQVRIPADAAFEIVGATTSFGGPLVVTGAAKSRVDMISSQVTASGATFSLPGEESGFRVETGRLTTGTGGITVTLGTKALVRLVSAPGTNVIQTTGRFDLTTGATALVELNQARITAGPTAIRLSGTEGVLKSEQSAITATGPASITTSGGKGLLELTSTTVTATGSIDVTMNGNETLLKSASTSLLAGGTLRVIASPNASYGLIELGGASTLYRGTTATMRASVGGQFGMIKLADRSIVESTVGNLLIEVGAFGTTDLADTISISPTRIDVLQGAGGKCAGGYWEPRAPLTVHCPNGSA